jgi:hypothetical protein
LKYFHLNVFQTLLLIPDLVKHVLQLLDNIIITENFSYEIDIKLLEISLQIANKGDLSEENCSILVNIISKIIMNSNYNIESFPLEYLIHCIFNLFSTEKRKIFYKIFKIILEIISRINNTDNFIRILESSGFLKKLLSIKEINKLEDCTTSLLLSIYTNVTMTENQDFNENLIEMGILTQITTLTRNLENDRIYFSRIFITLTNICDSSFKNTLSVFEDGIFHDIIPVFDYISSSEKRFEVLVFLTAACQYADFDLTNKLCKLGIMDKFLSTIRFETNTNEVYIALEGLYFIMNKGKIKSILPQSFDLSNNLFADKFNQQDGLKFLEKYLFSKIEKVCLLAETIFEEFFNLNTKEYKERVFNQLEEENDKSKHSSDEEEEL